MTLHSQIQASERLIQWLDTKLDGLEVPSIDRSRLAAGCLDVTMEHQKAIVLLTARSLSGSAASLVRIQFEAYVRGIWLLYSATDEEIDRFKKDKVKKSIQAMIDEVEKHEAFNVGTLSMVKSASWAAMSSFTHSGFLQIVRRLSPTEVSANYTEEEQVEALNSANCFGFLSAIAIADLAGQEDLAREIVDREREFYPVEP